MAADFAHILGPIPIGVAVGAAGSVGLLLPPLMAQFTAMISGAFGLGLLQADLAAQLQAAIAASLSVSIIDPIQQIQLAIQAAAQLIVQLQAQLQAGIVINANVTAVLKLIADLQIKLGGLNALLDLALNVQIPVIDFVAQIQAALTLGGIQLYAWSDQTAPQALSQMNAYNFAGDGFGPATSTYGVLIITAAPGASVSLKVILNPALPA